MPIERYLSQIVERGLERQHRHAAEQLGQHLDAMASQVAPETTTEQMEVALEEALTVIRPRNSWLP
jgi:hypothetical protein